MVLLYSNANYASRDDNKIKATPMSTQHKGSLALIIAGFLWGATSLLPRLIYNEGTNVFTLALISNLFVLLLVGLFFYKKISWRLSKREYWLLFGVIVFGGTAFVTTIAAFKYTTIAKAQLLHYTMPIWAFIFGAVFLSEKIKKWKIAVLVTGLFGIFLIFRNSLGMNMSEGQGLGNFLALISALFYAGSIIMARKVKHLNHYTIIFWTFLMGAILYAGPAAILYSGITPKAFLLTLAFSFGSGFLAVLAYYFGLRFIEAHKASIFLLMEVPVAILFAWIFFEEYLDMYTLLGGILILGSAVIMLGDRSGA